MAENKWENTRGKDGDSTQQSGYTPQYARGSAPKFTPRKAIRSFRDLDVYRIAMEGAVTVERDILPCSVDIENAKIPKGPPSPFPHQEGMTNCALSIPLFVAEAHGMRFDDFSRAIKTLEQAMRGCNKMVVYLELYSGTMTDADISRIEELSGEYITLRGKMLRLLSSWKKYREGQ